MSPDLTLASTGRILRQLAHDKRTIAIVVVVPIVVITLLHYLFDGRQPYVSRVELIMLAVFPIILMFLLTATAMVRERTSGTLERLMTTPIGKSDILFAYALAFGCLATIQVSLATGYTRLVLDMQVSASIWYVLLTAIIGAQLGVAFGLLASAVSTSEFQAVQLFPALIIPQLMLCGLFGPRDQMNEALHVISSALPITYAVEALTELFSHAEPTRHFWISLGVAMGCTLALLLIASATLRRRTP